MTHPYKPPDDGDVACSSMPDGHRCGYGPTHEVHSASMSYTDWTSGDPVEKEWPKGGPLTPAGQAYLAVTAHEDDPPRHIEDYEGSWFAKGWDAALAELRRKVEAALTSEDEIAHGEAVVERPDGQQGGYIGLGSCAYCDGEWPCRTQRGIERLRAALIDKASKPEEGA